MSERPTRAGVYKEITSVSNPIIKDIRGLTQRKNRTASNQFLVEGLKLVASCLLYTSPSPRDLSTSRMPSSA